MGDMRINKKGYPIALGILAFGIALALVWDNDYFFTILCQISCYFIASLGLNFITGLTGQPNLGTAGIFSLGAYTSALVSLRLGWSPFLAILPVLAIGWLVGKMLGYPSLRVEGVYLSLTTMVFSEVVRIMLMNLTDFSGGAAGLKNIPFYNIFGLTISKYNYIFIMYAIIALFMAFLAYRIIRSRWGRSLVAIRDNTEAVAACGINVSKLKIVAFTICCMFVGVGGAMYGHYTTYLNPASFSQELSTSFVVILIVGGIGTVSGALVGAFVVSLLPELLRFLGAYYQLVYVLLAMLCIIFLPGGIVPTLRRSKGAVKSFDVIKKFVSPGEKGGSGNG